MISTKMIGSVTFLYLFCTILYFTFLAFRSERLGKLATWAAWISLSIQTAAILLRWVESYQLGFGHAPLSNMYESLVFFSWCIALLYLLWEWRLKSRVIGAFAFPFAFIFNAYASLAPGVSARIDPLILRHLLCGQHYLPGQNEAAGERGKRGRPYFPVSFPGFPG
jgi:ABC-type transport system involved in cytochrome c biogenesis permease subunit